MAICDIPLGDLHKSGIDQVVWQHYKEGGEVWKDFCKAQLAGVLFQTADELSRIANDTSWHNLAFVIEHSEYEWTPVMLDALNIYCRREQAKRGYDWTRRGFVFGGALIIAGWIFDAYCNRDMRKT